jgi:hypothetical protein
MNNQLDEPTWWTSNATNQQQQTQFDEPITPKQRDELIALATQMNNTKEQNNKQCKRTMQRRKAKNNAKSNSKEQSKGIK